MVSDLCRGCPFDVKQHGVVPCRQGKYGTACMMGGLQEYGLTKHDVYKLLRQKEQAKKLMPIMEQLEKVVEGTSDLAQDGQISFEVAIRTIRDSVNKIVDKAVADGLIEEE